MEYEVEYKEKEQELEVMDSESRDYACDFQNRSGKQKVLVIRMKQRVF